MAAYYQEVEDMRDVLNGHAPPPISNGILTMMEVADAYFGRAKEMEQVILRNEAEGTVLRGQRTYKFRTGELRSFIEQAKAASELGSRRLTALQTELQMEGSI